MAMFVLPVLALLAHPTCLPATALPAIPEEAATLEQLRTYIDSDGPETNSLRGRVAGLDISKVHNNAVPDNTICQVEKWCVSSLQALNHVFALERMAFMCYSP